MRNIAPTSVCASSYAGASDSSRKPKQIPAARKGSGSEQFVRISPHGPRILLSSHERVRDVTPAKMRIALGTELLSTTRPQVYDADAKNILKTWTRSSTP